MLRGILLLIGSCSVVLSQNDGTRPTLPETVFGGNTFLPEIVPLSVKRSLTENGELNITIQVVYSSDFAITWVSHGSPVSYVDRISSLTADTVPSDYILQILIPRESNHLSNLSTTSSFAKDETVDAVNEVFTMEDEDFLVDNKELYIHFETMNPPEAVVLKLSDDVDKFDNDRVNDRLDIDKAVPKFPEMQELGIDSITITEGSRTQVPVHVLFTQEDRFSVRGLIYNSSSNRIFTTFWTTTYILGPSDFYKIGSGYDDGSQDFNDNVKLENFDSSESSMIRTIIIDIPTEASDISGVYTIRAHHETPLGDPSFILVSSLEQSFVVQRDNQTHGPIPQGVLEFVDGTYSQVTCRIGLACLVSCHVLGVGVQSLELMHKDAHSEFVTLPREVVNYGTYEALVSAFVDSTNPYNCGTYICKVVSGALTLNKEIDVNFKDY
ncbi:hypothetical protein BsWGS_06153 [Bradybaena similaris]